MKTRIPKKSDKIDLQVLREYLDTLDLTTNENLNFWLYCQIAMKTGLRYIDISHLKNENYNSEKKELTIVEQKTGKTSAIPFDFPQIVSHFNSTEPSNYIIFNKKYGSVISLMTINRRLKALYNGSSNISSHSIRKSCASIIYTRTKKDIYATMRFLNHSSIETTRRYLSLNEDERKKVFSLLD
jgi:integrase